MLGSLPCVFLLFPLILRFLPPPSFLQFGCELNVRVLTTGYWPIPQVPSATLPQPMLALCDHFRSFYLAKYSGRRLTFQTSLVSSSIHPFFLLTISSLSARSFVHPFILIQSCLVPAFVFCFAMLRTPSFFLSFCSLDCLIDCSLLMLVRGFAYLVSWCLSLSACKFLGDVIRTQQNFMAFLPTCSLIF